MLANSKNAWADLRTGDNKLVIEKEQPAGHFLGCTHERGQNKLPTGVTVTTMTYDVEPFFQSCNDMYLSLSRQCCFNANLRVVVFQQRVVTHNVNAEM